MEGQPLSFTHYCMVKEALVGMERERLEDNFDVIVVGTGLEESLVAAACARNGHSVLHLDANDYYGGNWASFNLEGFLNWASSASTDSLSTKHNVDPNDQELSALIKSDQVQLMRLGKQRRPRRLLQRWCVPHLDTEDRDNGGSEHDQAEVAEKNSETKSGTPEGSPAGSATVNQVTDHQREEQKDKDDQELQAQQDATSVGRVEEEGSGQDISSQGAYKKGLKTDRRSIMNSSRHFNIDLCPRLLYCTGSMVELLISSNVSRYTEFKGINQLLTLTDQGQVEIVPSSRADVFASKALTLVEKRVLMKFLTSHVSVDEEATEDNETEPKCDLTFGEYLEQQKLNLHLRGIVLDAIAMVEPKVSVQHGIERLKLFMSSLGRFGTKTPFLTSMFGSGEMPQAFCRLAAVFGAVYCLGKTVDSIVVSKNSESNGNSDSVDDKSNGKGVDSGKNLRGLLMGDGQFVRCDHLVLPYCLSPSSNPSTTSDEWLHRSIQIRSDSITSTSNSDDNDSKHENLSFLTLPISANNPSNRALVQELGFASAAAPKGFYLVHSTYKSDGAESQDQVDPLERFEDGQVIYKCHFQLPCNSPKHQHDREFSNLYLASGPVFELDYDQCISNAKNIFEAMYGGEPFLPRAPDPNEIVLGDEGDGTDSEQFKYPESDHHKKQGDEEKRNEERVGAPEEDIEQSVA